MKFLENFGLINPLITYVLEKYENKISRKKAKEILIKNVWEKEKDEHMKKLFENFKIGWNNIYKKIKIPDKDGNLKEKNINENDCLAFILNDKLEDNYGKYIFTAYEYLYFIEYQNEFLYPLITNNTNHDYLYTYSNQINNRITIQKANQEEIVSLNIKNNFFDSFEDLVNTYSYRGYYISNNTNINYLSYKEIIYDFESIENELSKILLPGKKLFKDEQDFIKYNFEEFIQNDSFILNFKNLVENNKLLTSDERTEINNFNKKNDYKSILFNLQTLLLYFTNYKKINRTNSLKEELNIFPYNIIKIDKEFSNNIKNLTFDIKLNKLIDFYEYIEFLNYRHILNNVSEKAKKKLDENQIKELKKHFNNKNNSLVISKKELQFTLRKFITRYLVCDKFNFDFNIFEILKIKNELWNEKIISSNKDKFKEEILQLQNLKIF
eukprot:jgi/Orpsp1_1/1179078/evm.model.c7180000067839.1